MSLSFELLLRTFWLNDIPLPFETAEQNNNILHTLHTSVCLLLCTICSKCEAFSQNSINLRPYINKQDSSK